MPNDTGPFALRPGDMDYDTGHLLKVSRDFVGYLRHESINAVARRCIVAEGMLREIQTRASMTDSVNEDRMLAAIIDAHFAGGEGEANRG